VDTKSLSIIQQKARGTYQRNQQIRQLVSNGENMAQVGRWFKLSRQAVRQIVAQAGEE
jgi:Mor family transcriptional regulator